MNAKTLEIATILFTKIQELDKDIIRIEKQAMLIANRDCDIKLSLQIKDLTPPKSKKEDILDSDGSLLSALEEINRAMMNSYFGLGSTQPDTKKPGNEIKEDLNITEALGILSILLRCKQKSRNELITELDKLGFSL